MSPALAGGFFITAAPGKPLEVTTNLTLTKTSQYIIIYLFILVLMDIWAVLVFSSYKSVQFSSVQSLSRVRLFATP